MGATPGHSAQPPGSRGGVQGKGGCEDGEMG